ncbi:MAG TPA: ChaN family lipoprotein [Thermoanaerobaculia bacterium]|nr:ChaN family lipoprotein [Thermoanaerobaculia bacterium]HUM30421.1 ChaN family lipoprotein [Thermoanaerobaculia bacterium]HXK68568.1 ChaN family lipoprotein [Thermoanaerobaculia bacterium]
MRVLLFSLMVAAMAFVSTGLSADAEDEIALLTLGDPGRAFSLAAAPAGTYVDCRTGKELTFDEMVDIMAQARIILLGEEHTNMEQHILQGKILDALAERGIPLILGMEFFQRDDGDVLKKWISGEMNEEFFLRESGWYDRGGYPFGYYRPVMESAKNNGIPVVGLNVDRSLINSVARKGLEGLDENERKELGKIRVDAAPGHRFLVSLFFGESGPSMPPDWLSRMYAAQVTWDTIMARSILDNLIEDRTMVVIVGSGHVIHGLGIPRRLKEESEWRRISIPVLSFVPVTAPVPDPEITLRGHPTGMGGYGSDAPKALFSRGVADIAGIFTNPGEYEALPTYGVSLRESDGNITVSWVTPDSLADRAGVERGDRFLDVNGNTFDSLTDLRLHLASFTWGDRVDIHLLREEATVHAIFILEPDIVAQRELTVPGWIRMDGLDVNLSYTDPADYTKPLSTEELDEPHGRRYLILDDQDHPLRIEVREGRDLLEVHELDKEGYIVRALYRNPLEDGTTEVRKARDMNGTWTIQSYDRTGRLLHSRVRS